MTRQNYFNGLVTKAKRLRGKSTDSATEVTPPENPATPPGVPIPYPNTGMSSPDSGPEHVSEPKPLESDATGAGSSDSFDEADALFGPRTELPDNKGDEAAERGFGDINDGTSKDLPMGESSVAASEPDDDGIFGMNGIVAPNNVVADPDAGGVGDGVDGVVESGGDLSDTRPGALAGVIDMNGVMAPPSGGGEEEELQPLLVSDPSDDEIISMNGVVGMNGIVAPNNLEGEPDDDGIIVMNGIVAPNNLEGEPDDDGIVGMNGIVAPNNLEGEPDDDGIIVMNGIVAPNNVVAVEDDLDDDLVLADLSSGSISDQLRTNLNTGVEMADLDLDDVEVDDIDID